jgi:predicted XRE-type DNA-binding protein
MQREEVYRTSTSSCGWTESGIRVPSTSNVFRDLGFSADEGEHLLVRADLLIQLQKALASRGLTQAKAAKILCVTASRQRHAARTDRSVQHRQSDRCWRVLVCTCVSF